MLACPRQGGWPLGVSGVWVWLGVHSVRRLCVFWLRVEGEARGAPVRREHTALSALTKPLCVAQGVGCDSLVCGQEQWSQHLRRGRGAKHFLLGHTRPS